MSINVVLGGIVFAALVGIAVWTRRSWKSWSQVLFGHQNATQDEITEQESNIVGKLTFVRSDSLSGPFVDKYMERLVRTAGNLAGKYPNIVVFSDEIEAIQASRGSDQDEALTNR
jgi:hypothetical protein